MAQTPLQHLKKNYPKQKDSLTLFLKKFDTQKIIGIHKLVEDASAKAWEEVNCLECANCCKAMTPTFNKKDVKRQYNIRSDNQVIQQMVLKNHY